MRKRQIKIVKSETNKYNVVSGETVLCGPMDEELATSCRDDIIAANNACSNKHFIATAQPPAPGTA